MVSLYVGIVENFILTISKLIIRINILAISINGLLFILYRSLGKKRKICLKMVDFVVLV